MKAQAGTVRTVVLSIAVVAVSMSGSVPPTQALNGSGSPALAAASLHPQVTLHGETPQLAERVEWAVGRFSEAGLPLPSLDITFHDHRDGCYGYHGFYVGASGVADIEVCTHTRSVILHELAHAWEALAGSETTREAFMSYWGLEHWNDHDTPWSERGSERAADTIAYALDDLPVKPTAGLLRHLCSFELLTDSAVPGAEEVDGLEACFSSPEDPLDERRWLISPV